VRCGGLCECAEGGTLTTTRQSKHAVRHSWTTSSPCTPSAHPVTYAGTPVASLGSPLPGRSAESATTAAPVGQWGEVKLVPAGEQCRPGRRRGVRLLSSAGRVSVSVCVDWRMGVGSSAALCGSCCLSPLAPAQARTAQQQQKRDDMHTENERRTTQVAQRSIKAGQLRIGDRRVLFFGRVRGRRGWCWCCCSAGRCRRRRGRSSCCRDNRRHSGGSNSSRHSHSSGRSSRSGRRRRCGCIHSPRCWSGELRSLSVAARFSTGRLGAQVELLALRARPREWRARNHRRRRAAGRGGDRGADGT
jgi:hypothetical protein